jgi:hypothetical protein
MSLINEALKKAQRLRNEDTADSSISGLTGGIGVVRRGTPHTANTLVLVGSGALVLVVLSVVFTVYLLNRTSTPPVTVATSSTTVKPAPAAPASLAGTEPTAPAIVVPRIAIPATPNSAPAEKSAVPPAAATAVLSSALSVPTAPAQTAIVTATPSAILPPPAPAVVTPAPPVQTAPVPALAPDTPDERITAFVESVRVTGIRSSGAESRVLMNERVYRVNDIVERTMNIRLIKAAADSLTFSDPRGVIYVKRF